MTLQNFLNKFRSDDFLLSVEGLCVELPFWEYVEEKKQDYWDEFKNREVENFYLWITNEQPELTIKVKDISKIEK